MREERAHWRLVRMLMPARRAHVVWSWFSALLPPSLLGFRAAPAVPATLAAPKLHPTCLPDGSIVFASGLHLSWGSREKASAVSSLVIGLCDKCARQCRAWTDRGGEREGDKHARGSRATHRSALGHCFLHARALGCVHPCWAGAGQRGMRRKEGKAVQSKFGGCEE